MATVSQKKSNGKRASSTNDISASYNKFKKFEGKQYTE
jgi:hypothetical protein